MNKKGLSDIITTVLIILLVLAAIILIWVFIRALLQRSGEQIENSVLISSQLKFAPKSMQINEEDKNMSFILKRDSGGDEVVGYVVVFKNSEGAAKTVRNTNFSFSELQSRTVDVDYSTIGSFDFVEVSIAPIILKNNRKIITLETDSYSVSDANYVSGQSGEGNPEPECSLNTDCGNGEYCSSGQCVANICNPACNSTQHCSSGQCVVNTCIPACGSTQFCGWVNDAASCVARTCSLDSECGTGYYCSNINNQCLPGCSSSSECGTGYVCSNHRCTIYSLPSGVIARYSFDSGFDSVPSGNPILDVGGAPLLGMRDDGKVGSSFNLSLDNLRGKIGHEDVFQPSSGDITFSFWIKPDDFINTQTILVKSEDTDSNAFGYGAMIYGGTKIACIFGNNNILDRYGSTSWDNSRVQVDDYNQYIEGDGFVHVTCSYNTQEGDDVMKIYINGNEKIVSRSVSTSLVYRENPSSPISIGWAYRSYNVQSGYHYSGLIDELIFFNRVLSDEEVRSLYLMNS